MPSTPSPRRRARPRRRRRRRRAAAPRPAARSTAAPGRVADEERRARLRFRQPRGVRSATAWYAGSSSARATASGCASTSYTVASSGGGAPAADASAASGECPCRRVPRPRRAGPEAPPSHARGVSSLHDAPSSSSGGALRKRRRPTFVFPSRVSILPASAPTFVNADGTGMSSSRDSRARHTATTPTHEFFRRERRRRSSASRRRREVGAGARNDRARRVGSGNPRRFTVPGKRLPVGFFRRSFFRCARNRRRPRPRPRPPKASGPTRGCFFEKRAVRRGVAGERVHLDEHRRRAPETRADPSRTRGP